MRVLLRLSTVLRRWGKRVDPSDDNFFRLILRVRRSGFGELQELLVDTDGGALEAGLELGEAVEEQELLGPVLGIAGFLEVGGELVKLALIIARLDDGAGDLLRPVSG